MLTYRTGEPVHAGDRILWDGLPSDVIEAIVPATEFAEGYDCFDEGGILLVPIGTRDVFLDHPGNELIAFNHRGDAPGPLGGP